MNQNLDKNNNILQIVCESTKCLNDIQSSHPVTNTTYKLHSPTQQSGPMCGRKQIATSDTIVVTCNLATKILRQYKKTDSRSLPNPTTIIRRQIPAARCLTYRFEKSVAEQIWEQNKFGKVHDKVSEPVGSATSWTISRNISKSDYQLRHVCPSAWNNSAPTGRIFMKFEYFSKICRLNSSLIKM